MHDLQLSRSLTPTAISVPLLPLNAHVHFAVYVVVSPLVVGWCSQKPGLHGFSWHGSLTQASGDVVVACRNQPTQRSSTPDERATRHSSANMHHTRTSMREICMECNDPLTHQVRGGAFVARGTLVSSIALAGECADGAGGACAVWAAGSGLLAHRLGNARIGCAGAVAVLGLQGDRAQHSAHARPSGACMLQIHVVHTPHRDKRNGRSGGPTHGCLDTSTSSIQICVPCSRWRMPHSNHPYSR